MSTPQRFKGRGRFDVVAVFADGGRVRIQSDPKRSLSPREIVAALRESADSIEAGAEAPSSPHSRRQQRWNSPLGRRGSSLRRDMALSDHARKDSSSDRSAAWRVPETPASPRQIAPAAEYVAHLFGCPSIGGNGDGDCTCGAVQFLAIIESTQRQLSDAVATIAKLTDAARLTVTEGAEPDDVRLDRIAKRVAEMRLTEGARAALVVDRDADLLVEMRSYLDTLTITGENIGDIRRQLFVPWDSPWNGWVRDETAAREGSGVGLSADSLSPSPAAVGEGALNAAEKCRRCFGTGHIPSETCDDCVDCQDVCPECNNMPSKRTDGPLEADFWLCKTCGCLWRDNHDNTVSLGSAKQASCAECEGSTPVACEPLYRSNHEQRFCDAHQVVGEDETCPCCEAVHQSDVTVKLEAEIAALRAQLEQEKREDAAVRVALGEEVEKLRAALIRASQAEAEVASLTRELMVLGTAAEQSRHRAEQAEAERDEGCGEAEAVRFVLHKTQDDLATIETALATLVEGLRELPPWLEMLHNALTANQRVEDLLMQEVTGLEQWMLKLNALIEAALPPAKEPTT